MNGIISSLSASAISCGVASLERPAALIAAEASPLEMALTLTRLETAVEYLSVMYAWMTRMTKKRTVSTPSATVITSGEKTSTISSSQT